MWIEYSGLLALAVYVLFSFSRSEDRTEFALRYLQIAVAAWLCESISISYFQFYEYSSVWTLTLGTVPLLVVVAWPAIVVSAEELAQYLRASGVHAVWVVGTVVLLDAAFVEPICVQSKLWSWNLPGIFEVPLIGILGWGVFAGACVWVSWIFDRTPKIAVQFLAEVVVIVATTLSALCILWFVAFRSLAFFLPEIPSIIGVYVILMVLMLAVLRVSKAECLPSSFVVVRTPGFVLLALLMLQIKGMPSLHWYALAFVGFYFASMLRDLPALYQSVRSLVYTGSRTCVFNPSENCESLRQLRSSRMEESDAF